MNDIAPERLTITDHIDSWIEKRLSVASLGAIGFLCLIVFMRIVGGPLRVPYNYGIELLSLILGLMFITGVIVSLVGMHFLRRNYGALDQSFALIAFSLMISGMTLIFYPVIMLLT